MLKYFTALILFTFSLTGIAEEKPFSNDKDKASYSLGYAQGKGFTDNEIDLNIDLMIQGFKDAYFKNEKALMTETQIQEALMEFQSAQTKKLQAQEQKQAAENLKISKDFHEKNKNKQDVVTTDSGLQYQILRQGKGKKPSLEDFVTVNYRGTLIDGTEFDSSYKRGKPTSFQLQGIIKGWQEALQLMNPGSKWKLYVPPTLGYGESAAGPLIQPNSTLIFEIELLSIEDAKKNS